MVPPPRGSGTKLCSTLRGPSAPQPRAREPAPPRSDRARPGPRPQEAGLPRPFCVTIFGATSTLFSPLRSTVAGIKKIGLVRGPGCGSEHCEAQARSREKLNTAFSIHVAPSPTCHASAAAPSPLPSPPPPV